MISLYKDYYMDADKHCYILHKKGVPDMYFPTIDRVLRHIIEEETRNKVENKEITKLSDYITEYKKITEEVKTTSENK